MPYFIIFPYLSSFCNAWIKVHDINFEPATIPGSDPLLSYISTTSANPPIARLAILHGYGDHAGRYAHFMNWMADHNIACHALDFRGHGQSAGKPVFINRWQEYLDDLTQFLTTPELSQSQPPLFVLGHSHGGLIAAAAAQRGMLQSCAGIILSAPYFDLKMPIPRIKKFFAAIASTVYPSFQFTSGIDPAMVTRDPIMQANTKSDSLCRGIATPRWFYETQKAQKQIRAASDKFTHPLLMLIPGDDTVADARASIEFYHQCKSADKTILHYPEQRHELLREVGRKVIFQNVFDWICRANKQ